MTVTNIAKSFIFYIYIYIYIYISLFVTKEEAKQGEKVVNTCNIIEKYQ